MCGRNAIAVLTVLAVSAMPLAAKDADKFSKIDALMQGAGMATPQAPQSAENAATAAEPPKQVASELIQLPANTVREETLVAPVQASMPSAPVQPVQTAIHQPVATQQQAVAIVPPTPQQGPAAKTVVMWGSGASQALSQKQSGFVSAPGLAVGSRMDNNSPETLGVRFVEVPGGSVFEFSDDVSIPASKDGVMFTNGVMASAVEQKDRDGVIQLMADRAASGASLVGDCALMSDHSNLIMKGRPEHPARTFLEVDKLELLSRIPSDPSYNGTAPVFAKIIFKPKVSKNANDASVNVWLYCALPREKWSAPKAYSLGEMSATLGHLFTFKLARVAEI